MDLFDVVLAKKLSGGGGGGGSSDFSTADVEVIITDVYGIGLIAPVIFRDMAIMSSNPNITQTETLTVVLYKGMLIATIDNPNSRTITVNGDIEYDDGVYIITGNCSITVS